jgi:hypothetical protein
LAHPKADTSAQHPGSNLTGRLIRSRADGTRSSTCAKWPTRRNADVRDGGRNSRLVRSSSCSPACRCRSSDLLQPPIHCPRPLRLRPALRLAQPLARPRSARRAARQHMAREPPRQLCPSFTLVSNALRSHAPASPQLTAATTATTPAASPARTLASLRPTACALAFAELRATRSRPSPMRGPYAVAAGPGVKVVCLAVARARLEIGRAVGAVGLAVQAAASGPTR